MRKYLRLFFLVACVGVGFGADAIAQNNPTAQMVQTQPVQPSQVVEVIRAARAKLEEINCCNYSLGFLVSRYHQGQLQIVGLGTRLLSGWDGKDWFRVSFWGDAIISIEDAL